MDITWYGLGTFRINERSYPAIITDPLDEKQAEYSLPRVSADIVTLSTPKDDCHDLRWKFRGKQRTIASPGEYEMGGLFITGIDTYRDRKKGAERGQNIVYTFNISDVLVCHLGDLGHVPTQSQLETIGPVHLLLIPVGVPGGLTPAKASEVVSLIEPHIVIPMNYKTPGIIEKRNPVDRFLKEMGISNVAPQESLRISSRDIPEETEVLLLEPQQG
jgi:L-ascorbate metabolism protein UlaG (beta-lactamase superfamily)